MGCSESVFLDMEDMEMLKLDENSKAIASFKRGHIAIHQIDDLTHIGENIRIDFVVYVQHPQEPFFSKELYSGSVLFEHHPNPTLYEIYDRIVADIVAHAHLTIVRIEPITKRTALRLNAFFCTFNKDLTDATELYLHPVCLPHSFNVA